MDLVYRFEIKDVIGNKRAAYVTAETMTEACAKCNEDMAVDASSGGLSNRITSIEEIGRLGYRLETKEGEQSDRSDSENVG